MRPAPRADALALLHLLAAAFALGGALLSRWHGTWAWVHLPVAAWFTVVNLADLRCPLTSVERRLRAGPDGAGLEAGFLAHHVLPRLGPGWTRRGLERAVGLVFLGVNAALYGWILAAR